MPDDALRIRLLIVTEMLDQAVRELRKVAGEIRTTTATQNGTDVDKTPGSNGG